MVLEHLKPKIVWDIFENLILKTPHPSFKEHELQTNIKEWVEHQNREKNLGLIVKSDAKNNLLIKVPASYGKEGFPIVMVQAHVDMVCTADIEFNFETQPIIPLIQPNGEWLEADGTTLGADDGIGVAIGLALCIIPTNEFAHGPLEILLTVEEETGLGGAMELDVDQLEIKSNYMINVDSGTIGILTIGSAGGQEIFLSRKIASQSPQNPSKLKYVEILITGLQGGHSGVEINKPLGSAIKLGARILSKMSQEVDIFLGHWNGGEKMNAIPRESKIVIGIPINKIDFTRSIFEREKSSIMDYYNGTENQLEPNMQIIWTPTDMKSVLNLNDSQQIISSVNLIPHGVQNYSAFNSKLVETSINLGSIVMNNDELLLDIFIRSSFHSEIMNLMIKVEQIARLTDWVPKKLVPYPAWTTNLNSRFLKYVTEQYKSIINRDIEYYVLHGGLETGIIAEKISELQVVALGPDLENAHTPQERVKIASVETEFEIVKKILEDIEKMAN